MPVLLAPASLRTPRTYSWHSLVARHRGAHSCGLSLLFPLPDRAHLPVLPRSFRPGVIGSVGLWLIYSAGHHHIGLTTLSLYPPLYSTSDFHSLNNHLHPDCIDILRETGLLRRPPKQRLCSHGHILDLVCSTGLTIHHLSFFNISDHIDIPIPTTKAKQMISYSNKLTQVVHQTSRIIGNNSRTFTTSP
ncbi:hypothetical protein D5F01_LYC15172 [Larimichthys crocea]|uniref:Uncharacterized protein n=1 Tax=Larimichthys crocea TaxID=215358 RepID=A0A6G0I7A6_LARCR|nr:hypothetical protein D5F01_LYC15172 [Larimichthys crocea]